MPETLEKPAPATSSTPPPDNSGVPDSAFKAPISPKKSLADFVKKDVPSKAADTPKPAPAPEPEETPDPEPDKAPDLESVLPKKEAAPAKTEESKPAGEAPAAKPPGGQLREKLETTLAENKRLAAKLEELERVAEQAKELEPLKQKTKELEETVRWVDFTKSAEYVEKYEKPIERAMTAAAKMVGKIKVASENRVGTADDVLELQRLWSRDPTAAVERAAELFGPASERVLDRVQEITDAWDRSQEAVEEWKRESGTRQQEQSRKQREHVERLTQTFRKHIRESAESRPDLFDFNGDPELKPIAERYGTLADTAFMPPAGMEPEQVLAVQAQVRNFAAAFVPTATRLRKAESRIAELEAQLKEFTDGNPNVKPTPGADGQKPKDVKSVLRSYIK